MAKKAGASKKQKAKPKLEDKEQSERFKQTARELGVDQSGEQFDKALGVLLTDTKKPKIGKTR